MCMFVTKQLPYTSYAAESNEDVGVGQWNILKTAG